MMPKQAKFSQPTRHKKISKRARKPHGPAQPSPTDVLLRSKSRKSRHASEKITRQQDKELVGDHIASIKSASAMELRRRYSAEANAHRNMKSRRTKGAIVHPDFEDFRSFLLVVGPLPGKGMTLDRIDNDDPEYAPGKVRWADKRTQNSNKGDSLTFYCPRSGMTFTTSILAKLQKVSPATIRKRLERGWTDDQIIHGKQSTAVPKSQPSQPSSYIPAPLSKFPLGLYSQNELAMLNRSEGYLVHAKDVQFHRMAHSFQGYREQYGQELFMMTYNEIKEHPELASITEEQHERHFLKRWPAHRPHTVYADLTPEQQAFINEIDPDWVEKVKRKDAARQALAEKM